jgi:tight adherence protein B
MIGILLLLSMFLVAISAAFLAATFAYAAMQVRQRGAEVEERPQESEAEGPSLIKEDEVSTIRVWGRILARFGHVETLRRHIADAGLNWSVGRLTLSMLLLGLVTIVTLYSASWIPGGICLLGGVACGSLPYFYVLAKRKKRFSLFASQFPEALDSLTRALKAGYALSGAMELLSMEQPEPLAGELRRTRDEWKLGSNWDQALDNLSSRVPIAEVRLFAAAVKMQNRMGGRLNDVLARLSETMRDTASLESEARAISAHSRITGTVLTLLPIGIGGMMMMVNPEYMAILFNKPEGRILLTAALVANVIAHALIRKLSQVKV